jgi:hypothetical protein
VKAVRVSLSEHQFDSARPPRWQQAICWGLIFLALATISYRLMLVRSSSGRTPMLSANDRSRWATVRALVHHGTYELDEVIFRGSPERRNSAWYSIDLVRHRGWDGKEHYYSSKPPLLATLLAGKYWVVQQLTGMTLRYDIFPVIRILLFTTNILPLLLYFVLLKRWVEDYTSRPWSRVYLMAAATFGTLITPFAVTLSNHLPAAISALVATYLAIRIFRGQSESVWSYFFCGMAAAFTVANELPALAFAALLSLWLIVLRPRLTLLAYLPGAAVVAAAFFGTNYLAHGTLRPAYAHRSDGPVLARLELAPPWTNDRVVEESAPVTEEERAALTEVGVAVSPEALWQTRVTGEGWQLWDPVTEQRFACSWEGDRLEVRRWGQWYEYERSYWLPDVKQGVDRGEPNPWIYAFHALLGHHGIFSLTPIWFLSLWGVYWAWKESPPVSRWTIMSIALVTVVCLAFYLTRPQIDRNYGGVSCGLRWMIWLTPLWLYCMLPGLDRIFARRSLIILAWLLLAVSAFSAWYPALNPWSHPWLFELFDHFGWIRIA